MATYRARIKHADGSVKDYTAPTDPHQHMGWWVKVAMLMYSNQCVGIWTGEGDEARQIFTPPEHLGFWLSPLDDPIR